MKHDKAEEIPVLDHDRLQKGDTVLYEGIEAELISVEPLLVIKVEDRIVCGAIHAQVEPIK